MNSTVAREGLLERLISTKGIVVRSGKEDAPFWYRSGVPGPFDVKTQNIAGHPASDDILARITTTLSAEMTGDDKHQLIWHSVMNTMQRYPDYQKSIDLLADFLRSSDAGLPDVISGGEQRDWFFSIPLAVALQVPHAFLLKSGGVWHCNVHGEPIFNLLAGKKVLHVADLLNVGNRYTQHWLPTLRIYKAEVKHVLAVAVRNQTGVEALAEAGVEVLSPLVMDLKLFEEAHERGLISTFAYEDIARYFESSAEWTADLLQESGHEILKKLSTESHTDREYIQKFIEEDPLGLRAEFAELFQQLEANM